METRKMAVMLPARERKLLKELQGFMENLSLLYGTGQLSEPGFFRAMEEVEFGLLQFMEHLRESPEDEVRGDGQERSRSMPADPERVVATLGDQLLRSAIFLKNFSALNQRLLKALQQAGGALYQASGRMRAGGVPGKLAEEA